MTRPNTIQVTAANGAKVRTAFSKRYFVVLSRTETSKYVRATGEFIQLPEPKPVARVIKRTDSALAAFRELNRWPNSSPRVIEARWTGSEVEMTDVTGRVISYRAEREKAEKKARATEVARYGRGY